MTNKTVRETALAEVLLIAKAHNLGMEVLCALIPEGSLIANLGGPHNKLLRATVEEIPPGEGTIHISNADTTR